MAPLEGLLLLIRRVESKSAGGSSHFEHNLSHLNYQRTKLAVASYPVTTTSTEIHLPTVVIRGNNKLRALTRLGLPTLAPTGPTTTTSGGHNPTTASSGPTVSGASTQTTQGTLFTETNGQVITLTLPTMTINATAQVGTSSPNTGLIGGVVAATVIFLILIFMLSYFMVKRRGLQRENSPAYISKLTHPFFNNNENSPPAKLVNAGERLISANTLPPPDRQPEITNNLSSEDHRNPFRDPEPHPEKPPAEPSAPGAWNALDRLQTLTMQLEAELRELDILARSGQLSESDHARLDEVKRIAGLTMPLDARASRVSLVSSTGTSTTYNSPPPSYNEG